MRHKIAGRKLNRTSSHRAAMFSNMAVALVTHEQIKTTLPKAKELRRYVEKLVTTARDENLASRRRLISKIKDKVAVDKLMSVLGPRYKGRPGGYLRILKAGFRFGDMAPVAYIEFVDRNVDIKGVDLSAQKEQLSEAKTPKAAKAPKSEKAPKEAKAVKQEKEVKEPKKPAAKAKKTETKK